MEQILLWGLDGWAGHGWIVLTSLCMTLQPWAWNDKGRIVVKPMLLLSVTTTKAQQQVLATDVMQTQVAWRLWQKLPQELAFGCVHFLR